MRITLMIGLLLITVVLSIISCQSEEQVNFNRYYSAGAAVYQSHCQNCHGDKGQGLAILMPPLTDSVYLKTNRNRLACYLQNGLKGKITINNTEFEGQMPATTLSPIEIAQVLTYITNSFGNKAGLMDNETVEQHLKACE